MSDTKMKCVDGYLYTEPLFQHKPYLRMVFTIDEGWIYNPQIAARERIRAEARRNDFFGGHRPISTPVEDYVPGPGPSLAQRTASASSGWLIGVGAGVGVFALYLVALFGLVVVAGLIGGA